MGDFVMAVGDLVKLVVDTRQLAGALTAIKKFAKLERECGGQIGIIIKEHLINSATVRFNNGIVRIIDKKHLERISE